MQNFWAKVPPPRGGSKSPKKAREYLLANFGIFA